VAGGQPSAMLLELMENYDCQAVVMGARGIGNPGGTGLGSVAQAVLSHCQLPVTVVREIAGAPDVGRPGSGDESG